MSREGQSRSDSEYCDIKETSTAATAAVNDDDIKTPSPSAMKKQCLCRHSVTCRRLTEAFERLNDPRKDFVRLPPPPLLSGDNDDDDSFQGRIRKALLRPLLLTHEGMQMITKLKLPATPSSEYIAAHHFHPNIVLHFGASNIPRTISQHEATQLGVDVKECCESIMTAAEDETMQLQERTYIVMPNYPLELSQASVSAAVNSDNLLMGQEQQQDVTVDQQVVSLRSRPSTSSARRQSEATTATAATTITADSAKRPRSILRTSDSDKMQRSKPRSSTNSSSSSNRSTGSVKVKFGTVDIREHPIIPGDNPGGMQGPPLTIDWRHQAEMSATLDDYEKGRPKIRTATEFQIPATVRRDLLRKSGFSMLEIQKYTKKANIVRNSRKTSREMTHMYGLSEAKEKLTRGLSNMTIRRGQKQREREYIQSALEAKNGLTTQREYLHVALETKNRLKKQGSSEPLTEEEVICSDDELGIEC